MSNPIDIDRGWEGISHVIESPPLCIRPDDEERAGMQSFAFDELPSPLEFLIQEIRVRGEAYEINGKWHYTTDENLPGYINIAIGSKTYICDLPIVLCMEQWHTIKPNLRLIQKQNFSGSYSAFKWCALTPGKPNVSHGRIIVYLKGILYRPLA